MPETQSQWILFEKEMVLLRVGETTFKGTGWRRLIGQRGRSVFVPAVKEVLATGRPLCRTVVEGGTDWRVKVEPVIAPHSQDVLGALGIYAPAGSELPEKPVVGATEWLVSPTGEHPTQSYWDRGMFDLYEVEPGEGEMSNVAGWLTPQWFNFVLVPEYRTKMRVAIDEAVRGVAGDLHSLVYEIILGLGNGKPGRRKLRLAGRASQPQPGGDVYLRCIMHEESGEFEDHLPSIAEPKTDDFVRAAFEMAFDTALCAVDTVYWDIYMTSSGWSTAGLARTPNGSMLKLVHPDSMAEFTNYVIDAASHRALTSTPSIVKMQKSDGSYGLYSVRASGVHSGTEQNRYALIRLAPV